MAKVLWWAGNSGAFTDPNRPLMTPLIIQTTPKTSVNSGWSRSITEKHCISGRSLTSCMVGIGS